MSDRPLHPENAARIVLLVGGPGAGKTTVGRLLADRFDRSVYHEADRIREAVVNGFAPPALPYTEGNIEQFRLGRTVSSFLATSYCDAGFWVIVDDSYACHVTDGYAALLDDPRTCAVHLCPKKSTLLDRMAARGGPFDELLIGLVEQAHEAVLSEIPFERWHVLDNSDLTPEETAERIADLLP